VVQRMFACRVAAGDWCFGNNGQLTPDVKPATHNKTGNDLFDCMVDNVNDPSIVVVYHDAQAYPECECTLAIVCRLCRRIRGLLLVSLPLTPVVRCCIAADMVHFTQN